MTSQNTYQWLMEEGDTVHEIATPTSPPKVISGWNPGYHQIEAQAPPPPQSTSPYADVQGMYLWTSAWLILAFYQVNIVCMLILCYATLELKEALLFLKYISRCVWRHFILCQGFDYHLFMFDSHQSALQLSCSPHHLEFIILHVQCPWVWIILLCISRVIC